MMDQTAFYKIGYGLYVVTTHDGIRDNGMICNTVVQVASEPMCIALSINKANYTHEVIRTTGKLNVNVLAESAPFSVFENFGFRSGRDTDKFQGVAFTRSTNGLAVLSTDCNACFSLRVDSYQDLGSHGLFLCSVEEAQALSSAETMTYAYYFANVKPKPAAKAKSKGYVCKICGYVYEGEDLPADFICPICKHGVADFEPLDAAGSQPAPVVSPVSTKSENSTMKKYVCTLCGYVYDPAENDGVAFEDLPADWVCPTCGVGKDQFEEVQD